MKSRRAIDAVAVEQRHRRHLQFDRALDQRSGCDALRES